MASRSRDHAAGRWIALSTPSVELWVSYGVRFR
jgi:hypothetical protein